MVEYTGFEECAVGRGQYGKMLTNLVTNSKDEELVIALNAAWGEGKTTFIQHWQKMLEHEKIPHISIDAFEHDHLDDAFFPIASAIYEYLEGKKAPSEKVKEIVHNLANIGKTGTFEIASHIGKHWLKKLAGEGIDDVFNEASEEPENDEDAKPDDKQKTLGDDLTKAADKKIDAAYAAAHEIIKGNKQKSQSIKALKNSLSALHKTIDKNNDTPFVIIIDEMDRCRPDFALSILEKIKHLFSVKNVVFVLSMNGEQIEKSIEHIYGQGINAKEYLEKFINFEFTLPKSTDASALYNNSTFDYYMKYTQKIAEDMKFSTHFEGEFQFNNSKAIIGLFQYYNLSLRTIKKLLKHIIISVQMTQRSLRDRTELYVFSYFFGAILKIKNKDLFNKAIADNLKFDELKEHLPKECLEDIDEEQNYIEQLLIKATSQAHNSNRSPLSFACSKLSLIEI